MNNKLEVLDTTLRDGAQAEGISFSKEDKLQIMRLLDGFGITFIEGGSPASSPKDADFFALAAQTELQSSSLVAFGSTAHPDSDAFSSASLKAVADAGTKYVCIYGKASASQVTEVLKTTAENNLKIIADTVKYFIENGKEVIFDAEHFFDGYAENPEYSLKCLETAYLSGARRLVLCDTNGANLPDYVKSTTQTAVTSFPDAVIGIHCHNDLGMAVACTVSAVQGGAKHIQGTFLGLGERCGNANLSTLIPTLQLKMGYSMIPPEKMHMLYPVAKAVAEISNLTVPSYFPFIGSGAFAHKAGTHADAVVKNSSTFEFISPDTVGNKRRILLSDMAGRTAVLNKIHNLYPDIAKESKQARSILAALKEAENNGYQFEGADASFIILTQKCLGIYKPFFKLINFKVINEQPPVAGAAALAVIKIQVGSTLATANGEGNGPVHALDIALRQALKSFYPQIESISLIDYKVRVINGEAATAAKVRVLITSSDGAETWTTVGVSSDVVEASWIALCDSVEYKLSKNNIQENAVWQ